LIDWQSYEMQHQHQCACEGRSSKNDVLPAIEIHCSVSSMTLYV